jgi:LuxR family maltose regulon positive regulatory protein
MSEDAGPLPGPAAEFLAAQEAGDTRRAIAVVEAHWSRLLFEPATADAVFELLGTAPADQLAHSPRAGLIAEVMGGLPRDTIRVRLPARPDQIDHAIRAGHGRELVEIAILAMVTQRTGGRPEEGLEIAAASRGLLQAISQTRFSPGAGLVGYWHLQAAQAALHAGDLDRARLDFGHAWTYRGSDETGYVATSTAPYNALLVALAGDPGELERWLTEHDRIADRTRSLIDGETMARPAQVARLLRATDRVESESAAALTEDLLPQLSFDEIWPITLFAAVRHLVDAGATERAQRLIDTAVDRQSPSLPVAAMHRTFVALARAEVALATGRGSAVERLLRDADPSPLPGLETLYAARRDLSAGDLPAARRLAVEAESRASGPRVRREAALLTRAIDLATADGLTTEPTTEPTTPLEPDLRRVAALLPAAVQAPLRRLHGDDLPPPAPQAPQADVLVRLSPAEARTLQALAGPGSLAEVANGLHVSRNTLKTHVRSLYQKLGASSREEAIVQARRLGLLDTVS